MEFNDEECYLLFLAVDNDCRTHKSQHPAMNALRERLLPFYSDWHEDSPTKVHPSAIERCP